VESPPHPGEDECTIPGQNRPAVGHLDENARSIEVEYVWATYQTHSHPVDPFGNASGIDCALCKHVCDGVNESGTSTLHVKLEH
jgi:hypothetical protein